MRLTTFTKQSFLFLNIINAIKLQRQRQRSSIKPTIKLFEAILYVLITVCLIWFKYWYHHYLNSWSASPNNTQCRAVNRSQNGLCHCTRSFLACFRHVSRKRFGHVSVIISYRITITDIDTINLTYKTAILIMAHPITKIMCNHKYNNQQVAVLHETSLVWCC